MSNEIKMYQWPVDLARYPKREVEIFNALSTELISKKNELDLYEIFKKAVTKAYMIAMYTPPEPAAFSLIVDETMKKYKNSFGFIREGEIDLIFTRGLSKEYGDFKGLSFITFVDWAKAYAKDSVRIKLTTPAHETKTPSDDEIYQLSKINALNALKEFHLTSSCDRYGSVVYDFLSKIGLIDLDKEQKNEYWREAKSMYGEILRASMSGAKDKSDKRKLENDYQSFLEGGKKDGVVALSKKMIVDDYFRQITMEELNLEELIECTNTK